MRRQRHIFVLPTRNMEHFSSCLALFDVSCWPLLLLRNYGVLVELCNYPLYRCLLQFKVRRGATLISMVRKKSYCLSAFANAKKRGYPMKKEGNIPFLLLSILLEQPYTHNDGLPCCVIPLLSPSLSARAICSRRSKQ